VILNLLLGAKSKSSPKAAEDRTHYKTLARGTQSHLIRDSVL